MHRILELITFGLLAVGASAHPGEDVRSEFNKRQEHLGQHERRTLQSCRRELERSGHYQRTLDARLERANSLRGKNGPGPIHVRDIDPFWGLSGLDPRDIVLQERQKAACVLDPEVTEGPYWVAGELIRSDVLENSTGVKLHLDVNVIDVSACKPIPNVFIELWGANSTGVYTGIVAKGNGVGLAAPQEINNSALRGVQPTNANGTASFLTVVPGHYVGRTNHLHIITHHGSTKLANNTIQGGTISHVGQLYFEQALLQTVEKTATYSINNQAWTQNAADMLFQQGKGNGDNPVVQVTLLGKTVEDGLYGFIDVGVNPTARRNPRPVNQWTAKGGVPVPGSPWAGYPWTKRLRELLGF